MLINDNIVFLKILRASDGNKGREGIGEWRGREVRRRLWEGWGTVHATREGE